jgi:replication factor A1
MIILGLEILVKETGRIGDPTPCTLSPEGTTPNSLNTAEPSEPRTAPPKPGRPTLPIGELNPYSNNWTIKARVTQKSEIRTWSKSHAEGRFFNFTLADETGEMRGVGFDAVVDQLYSKLEDGKVYYLSKARVKVSKRKFADGASDFELTLGENTKIEEVMILHVSLPVED